ncbi:MAG: cytochrome c maturation protein CcmE [Acidimicrobiales bacterium]
MPDMIDPDGLEAGADDYTPLGDLTPRPPSTKRDRKLLPAAILVLVVVALGAIVTQGLLNGTLFFHEVDDAVAERSELGTERFRMLGVPVEGSITETKLGENTAVAFTVVFDDVVADVVHVGDPPQLFQPEVPVTLEGHWVHGDAPVGSFVHGANDGWWFQSDRMLVKHDNDYRNDNEDRISEANERG